MSQEDYEIGERADKIILWTCVIGIIALVAAIVLKLV